MYHHHWNKDEIIVFIEGLIALMILPTICMIIGWANLPA